MTHTPNVRDVDAPDAVEMPRWLRPFVAASVALCAIAQAVALATSPADRDMGHLQKIMYVHVPAAWAAFACFLAVLVGSVGVLRSGSDRDDLLAAASAEIGCVLTGLTLALGSIWGRPTWGVWWTWDARLTSTAVLFVIFAGYLALRALADDPERKAKWSAAVGIVGALNVPIVYMSVKWWRTLHQQASTPHTLSPAYAWGLRANGVAFLVLAGALVAWRYRTMLRERAVERAAERAALAAAPDARDARVDDIEILEVARV